MTNNIPQNKKTDQYLKEKAAKKKTGNKALVLFMILIVIVVVIVVKITLTGSLKPEFMRGMPGSDDAYAIAKEFVEPTLKSSGKFDDDRYQFGKQSDSVYVIQSSVESKSESGEKVNTEFKIVLKYNGGQADKQKNWSLIDLNTH